MVVEQGVSVFNNLESIEKKIGQKPDAIIFLTDGYDIFPKEEVRKNIPVFWILTNNEATPPWGIVARIKRNKKNK